MREFNPSYDELAQTIARLEGELRVSEAKLHTAQGLVHGVQEELAASREKLECGHPKIFWKECINPDVCPCGGTCTLCAELTATRAECYERSLEIINEHINAGSTLWESESPTTLATEIRALIPTSDAAAREERK